MRLIKTLLIVPLGLFSHFTILQFILDRILKTIFLFFPYEKLLLGYGILVLVKKMVDGGGRRGYGDFVVLARNEVRLFLHSVRVPWRSVNRVESIGRNLVSHFPFFLKKWWFSTIQVY